MGIVNHGGIDDAHPGGQSDGYSRTNVRREPGTCPNRNLRCRRARYSPVPRANTPASSIDTKALVIANVLSLSAPNGL